MNENITIKTLKTTLPMPVFEQIEELMEKEGFSTVAEFLRSLIRDKIRSYMRSEA